MSVWHTGQVWTDDLYWTWFTWAQAITHFSSTDPGSGLL